MKKQQLIQIIKEEVQRALLEYDGDKVSNFFKNLADVPKYFREDPDFEKIKKRELMKLSKQDQSFMSDLLSTEVEFFGDGGLEAYSIIGDYLKNGCKGDLNLRGAQITELPSDLKRVGGTLWLNRSKITKLPDDLQVDGSLILDGTAITELPRGLRVSRTLRLSSTKITKLPDNLKLGGSLWLNNTLITKFPKGLRIGGDLRLGGDPLSKNLSRIQIRKMIKDLGGNVGGGIFT